MQEIYRELARGSALGEAVRRATAMTRRKAEAENAACPYAALYGDCALVPFSQIGRAKPQDDLRQVTIMSHDLVESTRLLASLGAERYSELLASYHDRCASIVARHGGVSDDPQGDDGIMCYFGVPVAHEDSAARALRAGLAIIDVVAELGVKVRIGIVTGQVVVKAGQPVGAAIHLAARLQSIAEPGTLVAQRLHPPDRQGTIRFPVARSSPAAQRFRPTYGRLPRARRIPDQRYSPFRRGTEADAFCRPRARTPAHRGALGGCAQRRGQNGFAIRRSGNRQVASGTRVQAVGRADAASNHRESMHARPHEQCVSSGDRLPSPAAANSSQR